MLHFALLAFVPMLSSLVLPDLAADADKLLGSC